MRAPFAPPRLSEPRKVAADVQAVEDQVRRRTFPLRVFLPLRCGDVLRVDQVVVNFRDRVLPDQLLGSGTSRAVIGARRGPMSRCVSLNHAPGEGIRELVPGSRGSASRSARRSGPCASRCRSVNMIGACRFDGSWASGTVSAAGWIGRNPLLGSSGALHQIPIVAEQGVEKAIVPLGRGRWSRPLPGRWSIASDALAAAEVAAPAETLLLDAWRASGSGPTRAANHRTRRALLPNVCPPAISATVSSSFIAMRPKVSRMSLT